jgi:hypothetical protein
MSVSSLTVSGGGLTWTLVARSNTQFGDAEIWTATAPATLVNATVTSTPSLSGFNQSLTVMAFAGAGGIGSSVTGGANSTAPSVSLTATRVGYEDFGYGPNIEANRDAAHRGRKD